METEIHLCECGCGHPTNVAQADNIAWGHIKGQPVRFIWGHNQRVKDLYVVDENSGCWLWQGYIEKQGYGRYWENWHFVKAHRWIWQKMRGPIPKGLVLDHLCNVKSCVNPEHLEPVTQAINMHRAAERRRNSL